MLVIVSSGLLRADEAVQALKDCVPGNVEVGDVEEIVFVNIRKAFTELLVSARAEGGFRSLQSDKEAVLRGMEDALGIFRADSLRRKPLQALRDILSLPENKLLEESPSKLFALVR